MSNTQPVLEAGPKLFRSLVTEGLRAGKVQISEPVQDYLFKLLMFYMCSDHLFSTGPGGKKHLKPLAELYWQSHFFPSALKSNLKKMGDMSLYISGFFREALTKKQISIDYYMNMGRSAYQSLSEFHEEKLFKELAFHFYDLVGVLFQIRKKSSPRQHSDMLNLLDQYLETGSPQLEKDLVREGISLPFKKRGSIH